MAPRLTVRSLCVRAVNVPLTPPLQTAAGPFRSVLPGRHWMEWLDLARPILADGSPEMCDGSAAPLGTPDAGLAWDEAAVARYTST